MHRPFDVRLSWIGRQRLVYYFIIGTPLCVQVYLLNRRFQQHQQIIWQGRGGVQDRTIYEDSVFAKVLKDSGMMEEREYLTYRSLFSNMSNFM